MNNTNFQFPILIEYQDTKSFRKQEIIYIQEQLPNNKNFKVLRTKDTLTEPLDKLLALLNRYRRCVEACSIPLGEFCYYDKEKEAAVTDLREWIEPRPGTCSSKEPGEEKVTTKRATWGGVYFTTMEHSSLAVYRSKLLLWTIEQGAYFSFFDRGETLPFSSNFNPIDSTQEDTDFSTLDDCLISTCYSIKNLVEKVVVEEKLNYLEMQEKSLEEKSE